MPALTLFVDESGIFEPNPSSAASAPWAPGLRVVVGIALPGSPNDSRDAATLAVESAVRDVMPWWPGGLHATELRHPPALAARVRDGCNPPEWLAKLAREVEPLRDDPGFPRPRAWEQLGNIGAKLLHDLRRRIGGSLGPQARVVIASEYGPWRGALPYARMVRALVGQGAAALGLAATEPLDIAAIVAARKSLPSPEIEPTEWRRRIAGISQARTRSGSAPVQVAEPVVTVADARVEAGLQIADLFAHALGPQRRQTVLPTPAEVHARTLARIRRDIVAAFGITPSLVCEFDAGEMQARAAACIDALDGVDSFDRARFELDSVGRGARLPPGTYPAAREQLDLTGKALSELNRSYRASKEASR